MIDKITATRSIWLAGLTWLAMFVCAAITFSVMGIDPLDLMTNRDEMIDNISQMTNAQRTAHLVVTATADVAIPISFAVFFSGLTIRAFDGIGNWFSIPAIVAAVTDLIEGVIQVAALSGDYSLLFIKATIKPINAGMFGLAALIAISATVFLVLRKYRP